MALFDHLPGNMSGRQKDDLHCAANQEQTHSLLLNTAKMSDDDFISLFPSLESHPFLEHVYYYKKEECEFGKISYFDLGVYSIQDSSAMLPPFILSPKKGEVVLDLCAAPGGKSVFMSLSSAQEALIVANDISFSRAKDLSSNIERMGLGNVIVSNDDFSAKCFELEGYFDAIMLDVPCSGGALMRKNAQAKEEWSEAKMNRCLAMQKSLLEQAYVMLKKGGRMVYSTCSFCVEEDEEVLASFLTSHNDMKAKPVEERNGYFHGEIIKEAVYLFPSLYKGEGQFFCLLEKEGDEKTPERKKNQEKEYQEILSFFGLDKRSANSSKDVLWSLPFSVSLPCLHLLREGLKVASFPSLEPDHALSHYLGKDALIELSKEQALSYLRGETFPLSLPNGFYAAGYQGIGLGFFKMAGGKMKNHLPKGLRKSKPIIP